MEKELRILMLEDSSPDADLVMRELRKGGIRFISRQVWMETDFQNQLREFHPDLILADYSLPNFDGLSALAIVKMSFPDLPFIFVSGVAGEETAVNALHQGAQDYILKNRLFHLVPAVQRILREVDEQKKRRQAEDALKKSSDEIFDLYNHAPCGYHSLDKNGVFIRINETELSWLGYSKDELVGKKNFSDLLSPQSLKVFKENFQRLQEIGFVRDIEFEVFKKDGSPLSVLLSATAVKDDFGNFQMSRTTLYDITELKKVQDALKKKAHELAASNEDLEQLIFASSHDLKGPLRITNSYLQLLERKQKGKLDEESLHYIDRVVKAGCYMDELLNDLQLYLNVGKKSDELGNVDCSLVLKNSLECLKTVIDECGAEIKSDPLPTIRAVESELKTLFVSLIENAVKYRKAVPPHIRVSAVEKNGERVFSVQDDGIGIDPAYFEKIFKVFQRLHTREQYPGTGVGLAICGKIVGLYEGKIWVESQVNQGSTFYFTLPNRRIS